MNQRTINNFLRTCRALVGAAFCACSCGGGRLLRVGCLFAAALLVGCENGAKVDVAFSTIEGEDSVVLVPQSTDNSPVCRTKVAITFIESIDGVRGDKVAERINRQVLHDLLGCTAASPKDALRQLLSQRSETFTEDVRDLFYKDLESLGASGASGDSTADEAYMSGIVERYSYYSNIYTSAQVGAGDTVVCYTVAASEYTGGAHPMHAATMRTYSLRTGRVVTPAVFFKADKENELLARMRKKLVKMMNVGSEAELEEIGFFMNDLSLTDDMLLERDSVCLHYNPYDIAPYVYGDIDIRLSYKDIEDLR